MPLDKTAVDQAARMLAEAESKLSPVEPLTATFPGLTTSDAYAIQEATLQTKLAAGAVVVGRKIGLTSRAMQQLLNVTEPDYGFILDTMMGYEGEPVQIERLIQPKMEGEIAFMLGEDLKGPGVTVGRVLKATAGVMPAFEIIDSRIRDWKIKLEDTIADNASSALVVLGGVMTPLSDIDLRYTGMVLERNGEVIATGAGAAVLGNPAQAVAWLANKLAEFGIGLRAGEFIMPGALSAAIPIERGSAFRVTFDRLGSVSAVFV